MPKNPKQQLYDSIFVGSQGLGFFTVDTMQAEHGDPPYPFVHIGEVTGNDIRDNKEVIRGAFGITAHVWALGNDRGAFSEMMYQLENVIRRQHAMDGFSVKNISLNSNELHDDSTSTLLWHGVISAEFETL